MLPLPTLYCIVCWLFCKLFYVCKYSGFIFILFLEKNPLFGLDSVNNSIKPVNVMGHF